MIRQRLGEYESIVAADTHEAIIHAAFYITYRFQFLIP